MTRKKAYILAIILALLAVVGYSYCHSRQVPPQVKPFVAAPFNEPGVYSCAQCVGGRNCAQGPCNLSCEYFGNGCMTIVAGFLFNEIDAQGKPTAEPLFSGIPGIPLRTVREDLAALGVEVGDVLTHINHEYIGGNLERLAELSANLKKGDVLLLWRKGERVEVVL